MLQGARKRRLSTNAKQCGTPDSALAICAVRIDRSTNPDGSLRSLAPTDRCVAPGHKNRTKTAEFGCTKPGGCRLDQSYGLISTFRGRLSSRWLGSGLMLSAKSDADHRPHSRPYEQADNSTPCKDRDCISQCGPSATIVRADRHMSTAMRNVSRSGQPKDQKGGRGGEYCHRRKTNKCGPDVFEPTHNFFPLHAAAADVAGRDPHPTACGFFGPAEFWRGCDDRGCRP